MALKPSQTTLTIERNLHRKLKDKAKNNGLELQSVVAALAEAYVDGRVEVSIRAIMQPQNMNSATQEAIAS